MKHQKDFVTFKHNNQWFDTNSRFMNDNRFITLPWKMLMVCLNGISPSSFLGAPNENHLNVF